MRISQPSTEGAAHLSIDQILRAVSGRPGLKPGQTSEPRPHGRGYFMPAGINLPRMEMHLIGSTFRSAGAYEIFLIVLGHKYLTPNGARKSCSQSPSLAL